MKCSLPRFDEIHVLGDAGAPRLAIRLHTRNQH